MSKKAEVFTTKIGSILGSPRFWLIGLASLMYGLMQSGGFAEIEIFLIVQNWALGAAGVGTVDRLGTK